MQSASYTQFLMLNVKKIFSEADETKESKDFEHFEKDMFFEKNDILQVFRFFLLDAFVDSKK
jgi:hypothetical protein